MKKRTLAILTSCVLMYSGFTPAAYADESGDDVEEVVVTADKLKELDAFKTTVITEEAIKARGARNVADALREVPGLDITANDTQGKAIAQFRGSDADNTKVYIDGVPQSPVGDNKVDLSVIPTDSIEKIEVIKGAAPVLFGTDAPGGTIYITTKKGGGKTVRNLTVGVGTHRDENVFASVAGRKNKLGYMVDAKKEHTDGYTYHSRMQSDYYNGKFSWDFSPTKSLTIFGTQSKVYEQLPNRVDPVTGLVMLNDGEDANIKSDKMWGNSMNWEYEPRENKNLAAVYTQKLSPQNDLSLKLYQAKENSNLKVYGTDLLRWYQGDVSQLGRQYWFATVKGWEMQNTIRTSHSNTITWGYAHESRDFNERTAEAMLNTVTNPDGSKYSYYTPLYTNSYYTYSGKSYYFQDVANIGRKLALSMGYRHDHNEDHTPEMGSKLYNHWFLARPGEGDFDNPVVSLNYAVTNQTSLHGSFGKSHRWPNAKERSSPGGYYGYTEANYNGYWVWPDGSLHLATECTYVLPEEDINREIGVAHNFGSRLKLDVTYFSKNIANMIKGQNVMNGFTQYYNVPQVRMHGFESEMSCNLGKRIKGFLNYTYTNAYDPIICTVVRDIPMRKFSWGLNYAGNDGIRANMVVRYVSETVSLFSNGNGNADGENVYRPLAQHLPAYHVVDLKVSKKLNDNEEYYLKITNLLDKKYFAGCWLLAPGRYVEIGTSVQF